MSSYNITRFTRQVLKRYRKEPPSLVVHLYPTHFRFDHQHGNFNYDSPMKCFLEAIREQKLPTDLLEILDQASVRYYEGCLIVEVHDHRSAPALASGSLSNRTSLALSFSLGHARDQPSTSKAEIYRIVLAPNTATVWHELSLMNDRNMKQSEGVGWTDEEAVELEGMILARTAPPLCLSPSIQVTRIANAMLRATTLRPPKRKRASSIGEGTEAETAELLKREREDYDKIMKIGDEGVGRGKSNGFARLAFIQNYRDRGNNPERPAAPVASSSTSTAPAAPTAPTIRLIASVSGPSSTAARSNVVSAGSPTDSDNGRAIARLKKQKFIPDDKEISPTNTTNAAYPLHANSPAPVVAAASTSKKKKIAIRLDSPDSNDPVERERKAAEKKRAAAVKKMNSKAKGQEKKKREAESVIWSNGKQQ